MMKAIVFGATGGTGMQVVKQLLDLDYQVTAVVREPSRFTENGKKLHIVQGDVLSPSSLLKPMEGADVVLSALGVNHRKPTNVYSEGTRNMMNAMRHAGTKRIVCLSASTLALPPETPLLSRIITEQIVMRLFKNLYEDMARMEHEIKNSGLDWTIIRPPRLVDGPPKGHYRVAINEPMKKPKGLQGLTRGDLASCMIEQVHHPQSICGIVEVTY